MARTQTVKAEAKPPLFENASGSKLFESKEQTVNKEVEVEVKGVDADGEPKEETIVIETPKAEEPKEDDATLRLKKQIEDLKKSEELQRNVAAEAMRQREEAIRRYQEEARRVAEFQKQTEDHEEVAIGAALAAAKAESDKAQTDLTAALNAGDNAAAGEAQRRLARAEARFVSLEGGKSEIEERKKAPKPEVRVEQPNTGDPVDQFNLPPAEKQWLRDHRDFLTDRKKYNAMQYVSQNLALDGIRPGMSEFLPKYEEGLRAQGVLPALEVEDGDPEVEYERVEPIKERRIVSAPVSRETSSASRGRKVTLTAQEREMARLSGITEVEYAKQKQRLQEEKAGGNEEYTRSRYGDR